MKASAKLRSKLFAHLAVGGFDACWEWRGSRSNGYGRFWCEGKDHFVHRLTYTLWRGAIPDGLQIDHLCRNTACANPRHLEVVSKHENWRRGKSVPAVNARKTHCKRGHEFTPENTYRRPNLPGRACRTCHNDRKRERRRERTRLAAELGLSVPGRHWQDRTPPEWLRKGKT